MYVNNMIAGIASQLGIQILFLLGLSNITFLILVLLTCRCMGIPRLTRKMFESKKYMKLYSLHCYFWLAFITSVILHAIFAFLYIGFPF